MIVIAPGRLNPSILRDVQAFRERIYAEDHVTVSNDTDEESYHVVAYEAGVLAGCLRYTRLGEGVVRLGAWCVAAEFRHTRVALDLALAPFRMARVLGDTCGLATATTRHHSAQILQRLGGRVLATYFDAQYGCDMQRLEFTLADEPARLAA